MLLRVLLCWVVCGQKVTGIKNGQEEIVYTRTKSNKDKKYNKGL